MQILYIGNKLAKHGKSPTTIDTLGPKFEKMGIKVHYASSRLGYFARFWDMVSTTIKLRKKVDLVCMDTYSYFAFYYALLVALTCRLYGVNYCTFLHGGRLPVRLEKNPRLSRWIFKHSIRNISPSGFLKYEFEKVGYPTEVIPNSIKLDNYTFKERKVIQPRLLYVRHFAEIYNPLLAIKGLYEIIKHYPEAQLNMVGEDKDGSLQRCKEYAVELGVDHAVTFSGRLTQEQWHDLSEDYDIFINTTNIDNTPVSLIEAMALGIPVVSTSVGGIPFMVTDGKDALLFDKDNAEQLCEKVLYLIQNPDKAQQLALAGRINSETYHWSNVELKWEAFFKHLK